MVSDGDEGGDTGMGDISRWRELKAKGEGGIDYIIGEEIDRARARAMRRPLLPTSHSCEACQYPL